VTWGDAPADDVLRGPGRPGLADRLERWVADARVADAAVRRGRERWLRDVAEQEASLAGTLLDHGERASTVTVRTLAGRAHQGQVEVVGVDFVGLRLRAGGVAMVATAAVSVVRTAPGDERSVGDRAVSTDLLLADVLRELAADRERVLLVTGGGADAVSGELRSVGRDVAVVRTDGDPPGTAYVPLGAITEATLT